MEAFTASIQADGRLARHDTVGSMAHVRMLGRQRIIPPDEAEAIAAGLRAVWEDLQSGAASLDPALEDVHMNVETLLSKKIGPVAGKLHTARSRNDQVALDVRLFAKEAAAETCSAISELQGVLLELAGQHLDTVFPGYTHLQRAQPVVLAHHWLAYFQMLERDRARFQDCFGRTDVLPLGSGALAGVPYPLDREWVAQALGFSRISANSLDAVSDRDFIVEYLAAASITMAHLSRLAEELVLWSSQEFGFIEMDDAFATGSSIMPQKKNPDVAELVRGKTATVYGDLLSILTLIKGLPLAYNRDLQEDKPLFFHTADTLLASLRVMAPLLQTLRVRKEHIRQAVDAGYALATDLADYLAERGVPFREAHHIVGLLVGYASQAGKTFDQLSLEEYRRFSPVFGEDVLVITIESSIAARNVPGGTAPQQVAAQLEQARATLRGWQPLAVPDLDPATFPTSVS